MKKNIYLLLLLIVFATSCHKEKSGPSKNGTTLQLVQDSIFLYAKEDYLWYDGLPDYNTFSPRTTATGSTDLGTLQNEVDKLSQYKINPSTGQPYEYYSPAPGEAKYSFIDDGTVSTELGGVHGDFGFAPAYEDYTDLRIKYVYPGSPADLKGIKRGYQIIAINGRSGSALSYDGDQSSSPNVDFIINAYANSSSITMTLQKPDATTFDVTLATATYTVNPVLAYKTIDQGNGHVVGYMAFNSFTDLSNAQSYIDQAFSTFTNITDLVVDLRYNGGGAIETAEYLDNLIVPTAKNGTLMYNTYFNSILQSGKEVLLKYQTRKDASSGQDYNYGPDYIDYSVAKNAVNFTKKGSLNINRVFFIMTGSTASASELTINNLRPVMDVQFIGSTSYGKPVGFFALNINKYQLYIPEFSTKNSADQGDYYTGFTPGKNGYNGVQDYDDLTKDFGDPTEGLFAHALNYVKNGTYAISTQTVQSLAQRNSFTVEKQNSFAKKVMSRKFTGMVINRPKTINK